MTNKLSILLILATITLAGCATTFQEDPAPVANLAINSYQSAFDRALLVWNYPDGYPQASLSHYEIYRSTSTPVTITASNLIATVVPTLNQYEDTSNAQSTSYYYALLYKNTDLEIVDTSAEVHVTTNSRTEVELVITRAAQTVPSLSVSSLDYYPAISFSVYRTTGNVASVAKTQPLARNGQVLSGQIYAFVDGAVTANIGTTYTYQIYGDLKLSQQVTSLNCNITGNVYVITY